MGGKALEDMFTATLTESEPETLPYRKGDVDVKALVEMLVDMWRYREAKTLADTLDDVKAEALFDTLADTIAEKDSETLCPLTTRCDSRGTG